MRIPSAPLLVAIVAVVVGIGTTVQAHVGPDERLTAVEDQLRNAPCDASLLLTQGDLLRRAEHWKASVASYRRARGCGADGAAVALGRGLLLYDMARFEHAHREFSTVLATDPVHVKALVMDARCLAHLDRNLEAGSHLTRAIDAAAAPGPDYYLERADALVRAGQLAAAARSLEDARTTLGPLPVLLAKSVDVELARGHHDAALTYLRHLRAGPGPAPGWQVREAEILAEAGRPLAAHAAYRGALDVLAALPPERRRVRAMQDIGQRARRGLGAVAASTPSTQTKE